MCHKPYIIIRSIANLSEETAPFIRSGRRRHHDERWKGTVAMKVEIEHEQLADGERKVLAGDAERWKRMGAGAHLDDWLAYGPGLLMRRRMAMRIAYVNQPEGRGYAQAFATLMQVDGLHTMDKTNISAVLWLHDARAHDDPAPNPRHHDGRRARPTQLADIGAPAGRERSQDLLMSSRSRARDRAIRPRGSSLSSGHRSLVCRSSEKEMISAVNSDCGHGARQGVRCITAR
jgi:hypothetical protein